MGLSSAVIDALVASGCTVEQLAAAMKADLAEQEARRAAKRENNAERQRRFKAKRKGETLDNAGNALPDVTALDKKGPQTPKKINPEDPPISPQKRAVVPAKPDDVTEPTWTDWLALRRSKRAPVTLGVIDGARQEAAKLGWTLEKTLATWVFRGSQGFQAEWITGGNATGPPGNVSYLDTITAKQARTPA